MDICKKVFSLLYFFGGGVERDRLRGWSPLSGLTLLSFSLKFGGGLSSSLEFSFFYVDASWY